MPRRLALALLLVPLALAPMAPEALAQPERPRAAPPEIEGAFVEALAKQWRGDHNQALADFERVLVVAPEAAVYDAIAESHAALGQTPEALLAAEEAARLAPREPAVLRRLASLRLASDDAAGAAEALERVAEIAPADPGALATLAEVYADLGHDADAVRALTRLVAVGETPAARLRLAAYARASGDAEAAVAHLRRAAALEPGEGAIALALADALDETGDAEAARAALRRFLSRNPTDRGVRAALAARGEGATAAPEAAALPDEDRLRRARDLYEAADEAPDGLAEAEALLTPMLASGAPAALALAGRVAFRQRRYSEAAGRLLRALDADPRDVRAWALALRALARSGDGRAARTADDALLLLGAEPDVAAAAAEALLAAGEPARALDAAPPTADGHALRALALAALGRAPEAADALAEASGADPVLALAAEGDLAAARGDLPAARAAWEQALALDPNNTWLGSRE